MANTGVGGLLKRFFGAGGEEPVELPPGPALSVPNPGEAADGASGDVPARHALAHEAAGAPEGEDEPPLRSAQVAAAARKMATLRRALEFEDDLASKVADIHTPRNMLLFMHQYVLYKFQNLHDIGMVGDKSHAMLGSIMEKTESLLSQDPAGSAKADPVDLAQENESLKRQLKTLYDKHVKSDIISGNELTLQEEKEKLAARLEDLKRRYDHSRQQIETLTEANAKLERIHTRFKLLARRTTTLERNANELDKALALVRELEAQNKLLKGRAEHQERLLQSMTWTNPQQKELVDSIAELDERKKELRGELAGHGGMLTEVLDGVPDGAEGKQGLRDLMQENLALYRELDSQDAQLEAARPLEKAPDLLTDMEHLREETFHLGELAQAKGEVSRLINAKDAKIHDLMAMFTALKQENQSLKLALEAKARKLKTLDMDPARQKLLENIATLRKENNRYQLELDNLHHVVTRVSERNEEIEKRFSQLRDTYRKNQFLIQEVDKKEKLLAECKRRDEECKLLKKETYQLQGELTKMHNDYTRVLNENARLEAKIVKVRSEYEGMINEYNKLFEGD